MRLAEFIAANTEPILVEWESFARSIWPQATPADPAALRDSAEQILEAVIADMNTTQSLHEQQEKSAGRGAHGAESDTLDRASQVHGAGRVGSGFGLPAVIAEYRALRASVLRLWQASNPSPNAHDLDDLTRFNESIDQSLALAVASFSARLNTARNLFLGMLGHDLRNPLSAIILIAKVARDNPHNPPEIAVQLAQIIESADAITELVNDLVDFASSALGAGMPLSPAPADLHLVCDAVIREASAAHPGRSIRLNVRGDLAGTWDIHRLRQMVSNLVGNALQHGSPGGTVDLVVDGTNPAAVVITVHNDGDPIPPEVLPTIFDPLVRAHKPAQQRRPGSIGLGLYIVREIAIAHGGAADLTSTAAQGTTATVRLLRHAKQPKPAGASSRPLTTKR
jgi:signal transduction histidine kinase